jgi:hypothetical protein
VPVNVCAPVDERSPMPTGTVSVESGEERHRATDRHGPRVLRQACPDARARHEELAHGQERELSDSSVRLYAQPIILGPWFGLKHLFPPLSSIVVKAGLLETPSGPIVLSW